jgi:hypothetical protein
MNPLLVQTHFWGTGSEWFWAFLQFVVIALTLYLIYVQFRVQTASHVVQSLSTIHTRWNSESMLRVRHHVCSRWIAGHRDFDGVAQYISEFMEELGNYLRIHAITDRDLWEAQSWYIEHYYLMFKKGIEQYRQTYNDKSLYSQFQSLFDCMCKDDLKQHFPHFSESEEGLMAFAKAELAVADAVLKLTISKG